MPTSMSGSPTCWPSAGRAGCWGGSTPCSWTPAGPPRRKRHHEPAPFQPAPPDPVPSRRGGAHRRGSLDGGRRHGHQDGHGRARGVAVARGLAADGTGLVGGDRRRGPAAHLRRRHPRRRSRHDQEDAHRPAARRRHVGGRPVAPRARGGRPAGAADVRFVRGARLRARPDRTAARGLVARPWGRGGGTESLRAGRGRALNLRPLRHGPAAARRDRRTAALRRRCSGLDPRGPAPDAGDRHLRAGAAAPAGAHRRPHRGRRRVGVARPCQPRPGPGRAGFRGDPDPRDPDLDRPVRPSRGASDHRRPPGLARRRATARSRPRRPGRSSWRWWRRRSLACLCSRSSAV